MDNTLAQILENMYAAIQQRMELEKQVSKLKLQIQKMGTNKLTRNGKTLQEAKRNG